ncbi:MAG: IclR family transcriptional regulator [Nocardioidaceae bacterium]|nr:IclR family transcriptional regulator [Nocardioidaceae bacterium]
MHYRSAVSNTVPNTPKARDPSTTVQSVDRAITILELLAQGGEAGVTELARELGVHKSTAFRLVAALERRDLVEQHTGRGKYRLGTGILRLAGATTSRLDLVQESRVVTRALAQQTGETVNIAVLSDGAALYMDQVAGSSALQPHNWVGQRIPLHATSNGKVLLSTLDRAEVARQLPVLRSYTVHTLTTLDDLMSELEEVRQRGYALAIDELEIGLTAIAAPVRDIQGVVIASVSISGPTFRLDARRAPQMSDAVVAAASEVSRRLGWRGGSG